MGVFEITQRQWELVMGDNPSLFANPGGPVDNVSYDDIRGATLGAGWPSSGDADPDSFVGRIRARTGLVGLDLPKRSGSTPVAPERVPISIQAKTWTTAWQTTTFMKSDIYRGRVPSATRMSIMPPSANGRPPATPM